MNVSIPDCFMIAFVTGIIFGTVYEALRIIRLILRFRAAVFVCDAAFFILAAMAVCKLSEFLGNYVRLYTVLGFGAGVFTYIVTVGRLLNVLESAASVAWRKTLGRLFRKIAELGKDAGIKIAQNSRNVFGKIHKYSDDLAKKRAKRLQLNTEMVYNDKRDRRDKIHGEGENTHVIKAKVRKGL